MIWVLKKARRQGVAKELVEALATHCNMKTADLAHTVPFCEDALHFWKALGLTSIYIV